jgi:cytochrome c556
VQNVWRNLCPGIIVLACLSVPLTAALAQEDEASVQYRQKVMTSQSASMGAINDILKNKLPFPNHIFTHAQAIQRMTALVPEAFKKEVTAGKTDAKPEIWKEWDKYAAASEALGQEAAKLAEVAQKGDMEAITAQVKKVGDACGNCHKPYRKPK